MRIALSGMFWGMANTGSGQYLAHLLSHLPALLPDATFTLPTPAQGREGPVHESVAAVPLRTPFDGKSRHAAKVWFEQVSFPRYCRQIDADVAHVPYFAPPLVPRVPTVVTIHDLIPLVLPAYRASWGVRAYTALVSRATKSAHVVITDSHASAEDIVRLLNVPRERLRVIYLAVDSSYQPVADKSMQSTLDRLGIRRPYLFYLGGFDQRKNVPTLLKAYAEAGDSLGDLSLVVAGRLPDVDTSFAPDPRRIVQELGIQERVRLTGFVDEQDKPALYAGATAFCFPSAYEGFGLPVLEAISCGTPVIVGACGSLIEVAGPAGIHVPPGDVAALASAMIRLGTDAGYRHELSQAALEQSNRFSWRRTAAQTLSAYEQAMTSAGSVSGHGRRSSRS